MISGWFFLLTSYGRPLVPRKCTVRQYGVVFGRSHPTRCFQRCVCRAEISSVPILWVMEFWLTGLTRRVRCPPMCCGRFYLPTDRLTGFRCGQRFWRLTRTCRQWANSANSSRRPTMSRTSLFCGQTRIWISHSPAEHKNSCTSCYFSRQQEVSMRNW